MGGFFGAVCNHDAIEDTFFGTDYHSHLGTRRGGMAVYGQKYGFNRAIHNITNSPFRTKFEKDVEELEGNLGIGCISDFEPQPLLIRSKLGTYAICNVGIVNNAEDLIEEYLSKGGYFDSMTGGKVNPLIGSAGVSAVPMAARVSNMVGQKNNPSNFLLMHAMGPNVAGVIGSAIAAGFLLSVFG